MSIESALRDGSASMVATERHILTWTGVEWLVTEDIRRGKLRGTYRDIYRGPDFEIAYAICGEKP